MKQKLFYTVEGRIFLTGLMLSLLLLIVIGYFATIDIETAKTLGLAFFAHTFGGRAAGIGLCIMNGFGPILTIGYNFYLEVLIVCFTYSIFVLTTNNYIRIIWVTNLIERLTQKAIEQKDKVQTFGWIGLFLFVMLPLPVTGPVMGSVIGYMLRINLVKNFSATGSGTLAAIIVWFFCFDFLEQRFHVIQYVFVGVVILALLSHYKPIIKFLFGKDE
ncbi:MAG: small multi-drug export protein [Desulfobacteraceae bacterium]|nr:small multi-drug export protein [Desulfobacteraceae bacterium]